MPTIVDSLVVSLGLDGSLMSAGTRKAQGDYKRLRDDATKTGKDLSDAGKRGAEFFTRMRNEALAFFAVFTAGKGLKAFVSDTVASNVALGNLSRNLNTNARTLDAWQRTARSFGASAGSILGLYQSIQGMSQNVNGRLELNRVQSLTGVSFLNQTTGRLKSMTDIMAQLNRMSQGMDPARFQAIIGILGGGQDAATVLEQQQAMARLRQMTRYAATPQDVRASQELLADWVRLTSQSEQLGRSFLTHLEPGIHATLKGLSDWIDKHPEFQRMLDRDATAISDFLRGLNWNQILGDVDAFEKKVEGIDWSGVVNQVKGIRTEVDHVVDSLGGWQRVTEAILALWVGSRFLGMLSSLRTVSGLLGGGPLAALLSTAGTLATALMAPAIGAAVGLTAGKAPIAPDTLAPAGSSATGASAYFRSQGWSAQQTAGIVANLDAESGFRPNAQNGSHYGIAQWDPARQAQFQALFGRSIQGSSYAQQLAFVQWELTHGAHKAAGDALKRASSYHDAGAVMSNLYEVPGSTPTALAAEANRRGALAELWGARLALAGVPRGDPQKAHQTRAQSYADMRRFGHEIITAGDRAGKAVHDAIVRSVKSNDFKLALANTDSPVSYSNALLSIASQQPGGGNTSTHTTTIHHLTVVTKASDAQGVAREIKTQISRPQRMAAVGNTGLQ